MNKGLILKNKQEKLYELAKELFLKSSNKPTFITEQNKSWYESAINDALEVAELFVTSFDKKLNKNDENK